MDTTFKLEELVHNVIINYVVHAKILVLIVLYLVKTGVQLVELMDLALHVPMDFT